MCLLSTGSRRSATNFGLPLQHHHRANNAYGGSTTFTYSWSWTEGSPAVAWGHCGSAVSGDTQPTWSRNIVNEMRESVGTFTGSSPDVLHTYTYGAGPKYWLNTDPNFNDPIDSEFRGYADVTDTQYRDSTGTLTQVGHTKCQYYTTGAGINDIATGLPYWCEWYDQDKAQLEKYVSTAWAYRANPTTPNVNFVYKYSEQTSHLADSTITSSYVYDSYGNQPTDSEVSTSGQ